MTLQGIAQARLANLLIFGKASSAGEAVARLGAVQGQDYAAAKWALGMRVRGAKDADIETAFDRGEILRIHCMRPTWHLVSPADVRWLLALTSPAVHKASAGRMASLALDGRTLSRCRAVLEKSLLDGCYLTRSELAERLADGGVTTVGQRLAYILMHAELEGVICSGPRRGKQLTYALLEERVPGGKQLPHEEALREWTVRYFSSHGPAQIPDFTWWSGLSRAEALRGTELAGDLLAREVALGKTFWLSSTTGSPRKKPPAALLLSIYDEYAIAYRDRSALRGERSLESLISRGNAMTSILLLEGRLAGTWKRSLTKERVELRVSPFRKLRSEESEAIEKAAVRYGKFLGLQAQVALGI